MQQHTIQPQSIAMMIPMTIPASGTVGLSASQIPPVVMQDQGGWWNSKSRTRGEPSLTLAASVDGGRGSAEYFSTGDGEGDADGVVGGEG